jgi:hypothetical protein
MRRRVIFSDPYFHISRDYTRRLYETMQADGHHHGAQHARLIDIHPGVRARVQPVAVVRNPWSRTVSRYKFQFKYKERMGEDVDSSRAGFEKFIEERHKFGGREFYWHRAIAGWFPQVDYVRDEDGDVACHILRQEFLADEISQYFGPVDLPLRNQSSVSAPEDSEFYSPKSVQIIGDWYKDDIDHFGFDFDTSAQKNYHYLPGISAQS